MTFLKPLAIAVAICATAIATAQTQQEPGLTDKTIKIGVFGPLSGNSI